VHPATVEREPIDEVATNAGAGETPLASACFVTDMALALGLAALLAALAAPSALATFPGRNGEIAFVQTHGGKYGQQRHDLQLFRRRTGAMRRIELCGVVGDHPDERYCSGAGPPAIAPNGRQLAFVASEVRPRGIPFQLAASLRLLDLETLRQQRVPLPLDPSGLSLYDDFRWWPGSERLLATRPLDPSHANGPHGVFLLGLDGSEHATLVTDASSPDASIDGRVAFVRGGDIHVLDPSGNVRRLTYRGGTDPSFSPRGSWVAFGRRGHVFAVGTRGGRAVRLARGTEPAWSPDGRQIAFLREIGSGGEDPLASTYLFALRWRTGEPRRVSNVELRSGDPYGDFYALGPEWLPLPR
jgi:Tol biopolymer transport system component